MQNLWYNQLLFFNVLNVKNINRFKQKSQIERRTPFHLIIYVIS